MLELLEKQNPNLIPSLKETMLITIKALIEENKPLEAEGHTIIQKGRKNVRYYVKDYENSLFDLK